MNEQYMGTTIGVVKPEYFHDNNIRCVVNLVTKFYEERSTLPSLTELKSRLISQSLKDSFVAVIKRFKTLDKKFNEDELYYNTEQFFKEKAIYIALQSTVDSCADGDIDTGDILGQFEEACSLSLTHGIGLDYFNEVGRLVREITEIDNYISTGWDWLDNKLGGGWLEEGKSLYIFAGETNVGKSIFLSNVAINLLKQGKTVVLISLEMSEKMYAKRISSTITTIPINDLQNNPSLMKERIVEYGTNYGGRLIIKEFPPSTITPQQLKSFLKKLVICGVNIDAVVLDYVNLLTTTFGSNSYERVKYIAEQCRAISYEFGPMISATQLNRGGYNMENPNIDTLSESYGLGATSDVVISIWQPEDGAEMGIINMGMMKNRFGPNFGSCLMDINYETLTLTQSDVENDTDESIDTDSALTQFASGLLED